VIEGLSGALKSTLLLSHLLRSWYRCQIAMLGMSFCGIDVMVALCIDNGRPAM
jgi:hypothetical protein